MRSQYKVSATSTLLLEWNLLVRSQKSIEWRTLVSCTQSPWLRVQSQRGASAHSLHGIGLLRCPHGWTQARLCWFNFARQAKPALKSRCRFAPPFLHQLRWCTMYRGSADFVRAKPSWYDCTGYVGLARSFISHYQWNYSGFACAARGGQMMRYWQCLAVLALPSASIAAGL